jgi:hypothetical protein
MRSLSSLRQSCSPPSLHTKDTALAMPTARRHDTAPVGLSAARSGVIAIFGMLKGWVTYTLSEQTRALYVCEFFTRKK